MLEPRSTANEFSRQRRGVQGKPFVGRVRELRELLAEQRRSMQGELRVAVVLGEPGLGKTQLAAEMLSSAGEAVVGLVARSSPLRRLPSFRRWAEVLGGNVGGLDTDAWSRAERHHRPLAEQMVGLIAKASVDRPVVVVLEDAHHGGDALWEMLLHLAADHPFDRVFVLVTVRPAELEGCPAATEALLALESEAMIRRVQLCPLAREDVRELAAAILRRDLDTVPPALVDWLMPRSCGNPRFAVGLLEALADTGADLKAPGLCGVPEGLACWIRAEVTRLGPSGVTLLELLAAVGGQVDPDDLAQIADQPAEDVAITLERLVRSGMVTEHEHDRSLGYTVAHPLVREVLHDRVGGARRRVWHRRAAGTLLGRGRAEAGVSHLVSSARAGDSTAIAALMEQARQVGQRGSHATVWTIVPTLHDLLPSGDHRWLDVFDALFQGPDWGITYRAERCPPAEMAAMRRMQQLLAEAGDQQRQAGVRLRLASVLAYGGGDRDAGEHECRQALALYQHAGREHESRMTAIELARLRGWAGDLPAQEVAARQVLREAESAKDQRGMVAALGTLGHALGKQGRFAEAEDVLVRGSELAAAAADSSLESHSVAALAEFDACRGRMVSARGRWARAAASSPHDDPCLCECGAFVALLTGDLATVQTRAREVWARNPEAQPMLPAWLGVMAAMAAAEGGHITEARGHLAAAGPVSDRREVDLFNPFSWWAEGVVAWAEGRLAVAGAVLQQAADSYLAISAPAVGAFVLADLAEVAVAAGDCDTAAGAVTAIAGIARRTSAPSHQALHQLTVAWTLWGSGSHGEAALAASRAADEFGSSGYVLLRARAQVAYARAAAGCDRTTAAVDALREAAAGFDACGAVLRGAQARELLTQVGSDERRTVGTVTGPAVLSEREREVAELAARGFTARAIGERLHIGTRTVETHLAHTYAKLGVTSKQQLVHRAAELGLTPGP